MRVTLACQSIVGKFRLGYPTVLEGGREGIIEVPSIKFDILVGLESILGKFILVDLLGASLPGFLISREEGLGSFLSRLTRAEGLSLPASTRWDPPGGGLGSILPVPVRPALSGTGVLLAWPCRVSDLGGLKLWCSPGRAPGL